MILKKKKKGFTIIELVIVIAVIAILAAVMIPTFSNVIAKANESKALQEAKNEYTNYSVDLGADIASEDADFIVVENETTPSYAFIVIDGQFKTTILKKADALAENTFTYSNNKVATAKLVDGTTTIDVVSSAEVGKYTVGEEVKAGTYTDNDTPAYKIYKLVYKASES